MGPIHSFIASEALCEKVPGAKWGEGERGTERSEI